MILVHVVQNSPEWIKEKLGKPSASECSRIITPEGKPSKQREGYLYELASERVRGKRVVGFKSDCMEEGHAREEESRLLFEMMYDTTIERVGIVYKDESRSVLCSPDGIINRCEGFEAKNPLPKTQAKYICENVMPSEYFCQVQFSLYVTGFKIWNFFSHVDGMKPFHLRVKPDDKFLSILDVEIKKFNQDIETVASKIK